MGAMNFCGSCGNEVRDHWAFCERCGHTLGRPAPGSLDQQTSAALEATGEAIAAQAASEGSTVATVQRTTALAAGQAINEIPGPVEKMCPECAETVKAEAIRCRYCGHDFDSGSSGRPPVHAMAPAAPVSYFPAPQAQKTNGHAVAALVLGIVWMWGIGSILALVFGYLGRREIDSSGGMQSGRGMAIAGIVLGWIGVAILIFWIIVIMAVAASTTAAPY